MWSWWKKYQDILKREEEFINKQITFEDLLSLEELKEWRDFNKNVVPVMKKKGWNTNFLPYDFSTSYLKHKKEFLEELNG